MEMRDRLIKLVCNGIQEFGKSTVKCSADEYIADHLLANGVVVLDTGVISHKNRPLITHFADMPMNDVLDLVRAKREGRIIVPPCKVGDTVYELFPPYCYKREEDKCNHYCDGYDTTCEEYEGVYEIYEMTFRLSMLDDFGKTVFLTKEEAEAKLKEREGNG